MKSFSCKHKSVYQCLTRRTDYNFFLSLWIGIMFSPIAHWSHTLILFWRCSTQQITLRVSIKVCMQMYGRLLANATLSHCCNSVCVFLCNHDIILVALQYCLLVGLGLLLGDCIKVCMFPNSASWHFSLVSCGISLSYSSLIFRHNLLMSRFSIP